MYAFVVVLAYPFFCVFDVIEYYDVPPPANPKLLRYATGMSQFVAVQFKPRARSSLRATDEYTWYAAQHCAARICKGSVTG